jgi:hypothetical protein
VCNACFIAKRSERKNGKILNYKGGGTLFFEAKTNGDEMFNGFGDTFEDARIFKGLQKFEMFALVLSLDVDCDWIIFLKRTETMGGGELATITIDGHDFFTGRHGGGMGAARRVLITRQQGVLDQLLTM